MQRPHASYVSCRWLTAAVLFLLIPCPVCFADDIVEEPDVSSGQVTETAADANRRFAFGPVRAALKDANSKLRNIDAARVVDAKQQLIAGLQDLQPLLGADPAGWKKHLMWEELLEELAIDSSLQPENNSTEGKSGNSAETATTVNLDLDYELLEAVYDRYEGNHEGLELREFQQVRSRLRRFSDLAYNAQDGFLEVAQQQVESLDARIAAYVKKPNLEDAHLIGLYTGWLESVEQLPEVTSMIRNQFQQPNLYAQISAPLVQAALVRPSSSNDTVNDVILGTRITGVADTSGVVTAELIPSPDAVGLEFQFRGQTISKTTGRQSLVTIHNTSTVDFVAKKRVFIRTGKDDLWRTGVRASLDSKTDCVDVASPFKCKVVANLTQPIVRRAALKRIAESKPAANEIARQRARGRLVESFDEQAVPMLRKTRDQINNRLIATLKRVNEYPRRLELSTTSHNIQFRALHQDSYGIGATTPPAIVQGQHDIVIQLHESMIASAARRRLANKSFASNAGGGLEEQLSALEKFVTFEDFPKSKDLDAAGEEANTPKEVAAPSSDDAAPPSDDAAPPSDDAAPPSDDAAPPSDDAGPPADDAAPPSDDATPPGDDAGPPGEEAGGAEDAGNNDDEPEEDARVTMASALPLAIYFDETGIRIAIRLGRIQNGDQDIRDTIEISAMYRAEQNDGVFRLVKHGELEVTFPDPAISRIEQATVQALLKKRVESMFKDYVEFKEIDPPEQFAGKIGKLRVTGIDAREGWLTLGFSTSSTPTGVVLP